MPDGPMSRVDIILPLERFRIAGKEKGERSKREQKNSTRFDFGVRGVVLEM
jgi:hypothetical protein